MAASEWIEPSLEDLRYLYEQAALFVQDEPWSTLTDVDLFAVEDPETGETYYCCVMGAAGIEYGLLMHPGDQGLTFYALQDQDAIDEDELKLLQDKLAFWLTSPSNLSSRDKEVISALELEFPPLVSPIFRSFRPGYLPTVVQKEEARVLAMGLEQARLFAQESVAKGSPRLSEDGVLPRRRRNASGAWMTDVLQAPELTLAIEPVDEQRLEDLRRRLPRATLEWEARHVALTPVQDVDGDPYWSHLLLCVDHESGYIFTTRLLAPGASIADAFLDAIEEAGHIPELLLVTSDLLGTQLMPVANAMAIEVGMADELPRVEEAIEAMKKAFGQ